MTYRKTTLLLAGILISIVVLGSTLKAFDIPLWARGILAFPFAFFLPGFILITVIAPRYEFRLPELVVLSIGLSIMVSIICTFLLNLTSLGISVESWSMLFGGLTIMGCMIGIVRVRLAGTDQATHMRLAVSFRQLFLFGLSGAILAVAWMVARTGASQISTSTFTQLWMLPQTDQANVIDVGIRNMESAPMRYRLTVQDENGLIQEWSEIKLAKGATWTASFTLPLDTPPQKVEAWLYRLDQKDTEPYRKVSYWYQTAASSTVYTSP
jgi:uncharacterized membrane protein